MRIRTSEGFIRKRPRKNPPHSLVGAKLPKHPPKKPAPRQKAAVPEERGS